MPCEEGRWRLLNPLSIRFSQPRIAPHYRDGHLLDETVAEVTHAPLDVSAGADCAVAPPDAASGPPLFDVVLLPPFPAIRVISWLPKIRRPDGEAERDEFGEQRLGKRAWFALDNRRLHSLQCAAAKRWPTRCCAVVRCIEEVPGATIRELRKFRTTTEGRSIEVGVRTGETQLWSWFRAAPPGIRAEAIEAEGLFAEDLWDAVQWAPHAMSLASGIRDRASEELSSAKAARTGREGYPSSRPRCGPARCPETGWQYVDPSGKIQGPFGLDKMRLWHRHGFFYPDLPMRCDLEDNFVPFAELFPEGAEPFQDRVLRYKL